MKWRVLSWKKTRKRFDGGLVLKGIVKLTFKGDAWLGRMFVHFYQSRPSNYRSYFKAK